MEISPINGFSPVSEFEALRGISGVYCPTATENYEALPEVARDNIKASI